ncbi:phosphoribosyltransferase [Rhizobium sp. CG5]|uniref:phosphoribosyltransferase n=1 Tax=Rhizobium sp. CG5 TaxID=2726076 RepID=UPI00203415D9|nr:phosphoribosyltransferase family protein [Rhizobium sp. CG5]MCM2476297.1 phosphoribosyltransferase [Rhizobium sp. CG5]
MQPEPHDPNPAGEGPSVANVLFADRTEAGRQLALLMQADDLDRPIVLGVPRGGVPVAIEVAKRLGAPLDLLIVRRIAAPGHPDMGIGAVVYGPEPHTVLDDDRVGQFTIPPGYLEDERQHQLVEAERRWRMYRGTAPAIDLKGRDVVLVDDGVTTGITLRAAIVAIRKANPKSIHLAVPVASDKAMALLRPKVDGLTAIHVLDTASKVGEFYGSAEAPDDDVVNQMLSRAAVLLN